MTNPARAAPCAVVGAEDGDDEVQRLRSDAAPAWATGNDGGGGACVAGVERRARRAPIQIGSGEVWGVATWGEGVVRGLGFPGGSG